MLKGMVITMDERQEKYLSELERIQKGGPEKYHLSLKKQNKLFVRDRLNLLFDESSILEEGTFSNCLDPELPEDGNIVGMAKINGRLVCFAAADFTVKAGSWGAKGVRKLLYIQEKALSMKLPIIYLVDSAGARITDQKDVFPGRNHIGRVFYNQIEMSGIIPQITILFGVSPAGAAYLPAFSDLVIMVEGKASAFLGSPRMVEAVIGEKVSLEDLGGARMHCKVSGLGDVLAADDTHAIELCKNYFAFLPQNYLEKPAPAAAKEPSEGRPIAEIIPHNQNQPFDMYELIHRIIDEGSFLEYKALFAQELITGWARIKGETVGIVANQSKVKGGTLFVDSSDKGARFIWLCSAYNIPLVFLADIPGYMVGSQVERAGIIRHGAKMISAVSEATVPKITVIVRKCYGAGLYAMAGPAFGTDSVLALPTALIAVMGPEAAVKAVYSNKIDELEGEAKLAFMNQKKEEYSDNINIYGLASELIVDQLIDFEGVRKELSYRLEAYRNKERVWPQKNNSIHPV